MRYFWNRGCLEFLVSFLPRLKVGPVDRDSPEHRLWVDGVGTELGQSSHRQCRGIRQGPPAGQPRSSLLPGQREAGAHGQGGKGHLFPDSKGPQGLWPGELTRRWRPLLRPPYSRAGPGALPCCWPSLSTPTTWHGRPVAAPPYTWLCRVQHRPEGGASGRPPPTAYLAPGRPWGCRTPPAQHWPVVRGGGGGGGRLWVPAPPSGSRPPRPTAPPLGCGGGGTAVRPDFLQGQPPCRNPQASLHPSFRICLFTLFSRGGGGERQLWVGCFCFLEPQDGPPSPKKSESKYVTAHKRANGLRLPMKVRPVLPADSLHEGGEGGGAWERDVMGSSWASPGTPLSSSSKSPSWQVWRED